MGIASLGRWSPTRIKCVAFGMVLLKLKVDIFPEPAALKPSNGFCPGVSMRAYSKSLVIALLIIALGALIGFVIAAKLVH